MDQQRRPIIENSDARFLALHGRPITPGTLELAERKRFLSPEERRDQLQKARAEYLHRFEKKVEQRLEDFQVEEYLQEVERTLDMLKNKDVPEMTPEEEKQFREQLLTLAVCFKPELQESFIAWVTQPKIASDSWMSHMKQEWLKRLRTNQLIETSLKRLNFLNLPGELEDEKLDTKVVGRVQNVFDLMKGLQTEFVLPQESIVCEFFIHTAIASAEQINQAKPTLSERLLGKKTATPKEQLEQLMRGLQPAYGQKQVRNLSVSDRIRTSIKQTRLQPSAPSEIYIPQNTKDVSLIVRKIQSEVSGVMDSLPAPSDPVVTGLEEYNKKYAFDGHFESVMLALRPILGREIFVKHLSFSSRSTVSEFGDADGNFDIREKKITMGPLIDWQETGIENERERAQWVRLLVHETAHAMQLEQTLSLREAIRFSVEIDESIKMSGHITPYSSHALPSTKVIFDQAEQAGRIPVNKKSALNDTGFHEEWAEMFSYAPLSNFLEVYYPEKQAMVVKYLAKVGIDFEQLRQGFVGEGGVRF